MLVVIALVFSRPADLNRRGQEIRAAARALAENQAKHGPAAPPRCIGPCVRTLSSDFALAHGNFSASSWPVPPACSEMMLNAVPPGSVRETVNSAFDPRVCEGSSVY